MMEFPKSGRFPEKTSENGQEPPIEEWGRELSEVGQLEWGEKERAEQREEQHAKEKDAQRGLNEWEMEERLGEDHLTGLKNRKFFEKELEKALTAIRAGIEEHRRVGSEPLKEVSLLFIDLDNFKQVNDTEGHLVGDNVLKMVARILTRSVREADVVGRFGGDEFYILLPRANEEDAVAIGNKILANMKDDSDFNKFKVTASLGVYSINASNATDSAETIIKNADDAQKKAKQGGKNRIEISGK